MIDSTLSGSAEIPADVMTKPKKLTSVCKNFDLSQFTVSPVSYTHLDVYKRQAVGSVLFLGSLFNVMQLLLTINSSVLSSKSF